MPRPSGVVGPPRERLEVLRTWVSHAKKVAKNTTIKEGPWTTGRQAGWGNARDTLDKGLTLAYPKGRR